MKRISLALLAAALVALSAAPHAATLGVSMALFDDNFLTAVRASMKERAQQLNVPIQFEDAQNDIGRQLRSALRSYVRADCSSQGGLVRNS
jgi:inositol transport system substrate-binding protein